MLLKMSSILFYLMFMKKFCSQLAISFSSSMLTRDSEQAQMSLRGNARHQFLCDMNFTYKIRKIESWHGLRRLLELILQPIRAVSYILELSDCGGTIQGNDSLMVVSALLPLFQSMINRGISPALCSATSVLGWFLEFCLPHTCHVDGRAIWLGCCCYCFCIFVNSESCF